jgi:enoyl-[acyl-carrier protein] reductase I
MEGKRVMVFGVANERSIAWGISRVLHEHGARLGFNFAGEALEKRVRPLAESVDAELVVPCDVTDDAQVTQAFPRSGRSGAGSTSWSIPWPMRGGKS